MNFSLHFLVAWKVFSDLNIRGMTASYEERGKFSTSLLPMGTLQCMKHSQASDHCSSSQGMTALPAWECIEFLCIDQLHPTSCEWLTPEPLGAGQHWFPARVNATYFSQTKFQILAPSLFIAALITLRLIYSDLNSRTHKCVTFKFECKWNNMYLSYSDVNML